jgi:large subunit ribosomal protein L3
MKFIIAKKTEMTQLWEGDQVIAVTKVKVDNCVVTQIKNKEKDGYSAIQLSFGKRKEKNINKPQLGHMNKAKVRALRMREFRIPEEEIKKNDLKIGDIIDIESFVKGDIIKISGTSKGRGFQGVVKRYGFKGSKMTHGNKDQGRMPGSVGATGPAHVFKGTRMGGRMGGDRITITNLEIIGIDKNKNELIIKGGVPGHRNGLLLISGQGDLKIEKKETVENSVEFDKTENKRTDSQPAKETKSENNQKESSEAEVKDEKEEKGSK